MMTEHEHDGSAIPIGDEQEAAPALEELIRAATRLMMGSAGLAISSATRWQRAEGGADGGAGGVGDLASAALGLGLATERVVVRGASTVGGTAASVTWSVMHASPLRRPLERLADRFRSEQRLSEREVSAAAGAIFDAVGEAVIARIDIDRVIDRLALERVLVRVDREEIERRMRGADVPIGG